LSKPTIIIQARTSSKRFPKKVLATIQNKPLIWHVINRAKKVKGVKQIILTTTKEVEDKVLVNIANNSKILSFVGSEKDVLNRYFQCALKYEADPIIRITGDCPLIDPEIISKLLRVFRKNQFDYLTNTLNPTFPDGLDVEIFSFLALEKANSRAKLRSEREHVTPFIKKKSNKFTIHNYENEIDLSKYRLTVDRKEDLVLIRKIYSIMKPKKIFGLKQILKILYKKPEIFEINSGIKRNEGYLLSLKNDSK